MSAPVHHKYGEARLVQLVVVDHALSSGVWPCWATQSWLSPSQVPTPSITAKTAGLPGVHCLHSDCMLASLVGSNWTMIGLILRPLMPPALLIWFTKRWIAGICSLYSLSSAKPSFPARLLMATTGKTTLMLVAVTPRGLVLAWETGVAAVLDGPNSAAPALPDPPGVPAGARTSQAMSPTTMAMMMSAVRTCVARGRRRMRRQERPNGARGWKPAPLCAGTSMLASIF